MITKIDLDAITEADLQIFKLQQQIGPSRRRWMLLYNESQDLHYLGPLTDELSEFMAGRMKMYVWAMLVGTELVVAREAEEQEW